MSVALSVFKLSVQNVHQLQQHTIEVSAHHCNSLPQHITSSPSLHVFRTRLKTNLFSRPSTDFCCCNDIYHCGYLSHCFYRAMLRRAWYCQGKLSVRPSVCLSVCPSITLRYPGHIGWNSSKIISRLISVTLSLSAEPGRPHHHGSTPKGTLPNFSRNRRGVGKIVDFRHLSRRI